MLEQKFAMREMRIAVLIDADNISHTYAGEMMEEIARYGNPTIKRIYGDWSRPHLNGWRSLLLDHAITPCQQFAYTTGKNATDSAMIIDAMDILYSGNTDAFCLVSSDSDFTSLAMRLREAGKTVIGIGEEKTPNAFIASCDRFIYLEILSYMHEDGYGEYYEEAPKEVFKNDRAQARNQNERSSGYGSGPSGGSRGEKNDKAEKSERVEKTERVDKHDKNEKSAKQSKQEGKNEKNQQQNQHYQEKNFNGLFSPDSAVRLIQPAQSFANSEENRVIKRIDADLIRQITQSVTDMGDETGWAYLGAVGNHLLKKRPAFDSRHYGFQKLSKLIISTGRFDVDHRDGVGNQKLVYIKLKKNR